MESYSSWFYSTSATPCGFLKGEVIDIQLDPLRSFACSVLCDRACPLWNKKHSRFTCDKQNSCVSMNLKCLILDGCPPLLLFSESWASEVQSSISWPGCRQTLPWLCFNMPKKKLPAAKSKINNNGIKILEIHLCAISYQRDVQHNLYTAKCTNYRTTFKHFSSPNLSLHDQNSNLVHCSIYYRRNRESANWKKTKPNSAHEAALNKKGLQNSLLELAKHHSLPWCPWAKGSPTVSQPGMIKHITSRAEISRSWPEGLFRYSKEFGSRPTVTM